MLANITKPCTILRVPCDDESMGAGDFLYQTALHNSRLHLSLGQECVKFIYSKMLLYCQTPQATYVDELHLSNESHFNTYSDYKLL